MCAWNEQEIVILGGITYEDFDDDDEFLGDAWVLDARNDTMRQILEPCESSLKF